MILKQKLGGKTKEFELINNKELRIKEKESGTLKEWTVNLENIGHNLVYEEATRKRLYYVAGFFAYTLFLSLLLYS
jgi:hypothetical protein